MGTLQFNSHRLPSFSAPYNFHCTSNAHANFKLSGHVSFSRAKIRATATIPDSDSQAKTTAKTTAQLSVVNFAFVHSVLLPDGSPDIHHRTACGGQKLRDIMLDNNIDLYGPYAKPLSNCGGGGTCATCMVEVVQGQELLSPRTDKEKEKLKRQPKNWRLACQTTVGQPDSTGLVVIQQLPEWKGHEWKYKKI